ncbi:MAG TPA: DinB family protein [Phycisphaerales bacterium]|nr:DinB family protein [Phycisphaerales bacterium]
MSVPTAPVPSVPGYRPYPAAGLEDVAALPRAGLLARYARGVENFDRRVFDLSPQQLDAAFPPEAGVGEWPVRVLLGHLADADLVFTHRLRRVVGEDNPVFSTWDENQFIEAGLYGPPRAGPAGADGFAAGGFVAVIHTLRAWTGPWLATLDDPRWDRQGLHPEYGPQSVRRIVAVTTWHLEHHARYLNLKVARLLGPVSAGEGA